MPLLSPLDHPLLNVPTVWHVIQKNDTLEGGHLPEQQITDQITVLNDAFSGSALKFNLLNFTYITEADWFAKSSPFE